MMTSKFSDPEDFQLMLTQSSVDLHFIKVNESYDMKIRNYHMQECYAIKGTHNVFESIQIRASNYGIL